MTMQTFMVFIVAFIASLIFATKCEEASFIEVGMAPGVKYNNFEENLLRLTSEKHHRGIRAPDTCKIPFNKEKNYELKCKLYPSKTECIQKCMFGHTFREGTQRVMKCKHSENRWMNTAEFEQCRPFIDCNLALGPGAYSKCTSNFMDRGAVCDVSCAHFEDKEAVPLKTYHCDIKGKWTPELPFCVKAGSGIQLLPRPKGL